MSAQAKGKQGWLENAFTSSKWDSRIKSANTTKKELWLGFVIGPYGMPLVFDGDRVYINWEDGWKIEDYK